MVLPLMRDFESLSSHPGGKVLGEEWRAGGKGGTGGQPRNSGVPGHRALSQVPGDIHHPTGNTQGKPGKERTPPLSPLPSPGDGCQEWRVPKSQLRTQRERRKRGEQ